MFYKYSSSIGSGTNTNYNTERNAKSDRTGSKILLPWILITWIILVFNIVAGIVFGLDITYPFQVKYGLNLKGIENKCQ